MAEFATKKYFYIILWLILWDIDFALSQTISQVQFINEALSAHNEYRKRHGCKPLIHNEELSKIAQRYAEQLARSGAFSHSGNKYNGQHLGENLAYYYRTGLTKYDIATKLWYDEIKDYDYRNPGFSMETGHFTQVVWKNTKEVGFGIAKANDDRLYVVANYYPAGNYQGQYKENVPPPNREIKFPNQANSFKYYLNLIVLCLTLQFIMIFS